jgi:hypothetical protein
MSYWEMVNFLYTALKLLFVDYGFDPMPDNKQCYISKSNT